MSFLTNDIFSNYGDNVHIKLDKTGSYESSRIGKQRVNANTFDMGIGIPKDYGKLVSHLKIKKFDNSILYKDILTYGYPSGNLSFDENDSLRMSSTIQFGKVTGLMPTDAYHIPWGLQTDIVGTSGSSGSPLVDPSDGSKKI